MTPHSDQGDAPAAGRHGTSDETPTSPTRHVTRTPRRLTIDSKGAVVPAPYGLGRWSRPTVYACAHPDCPNPAHVLKTANAHSAPSEPADPSLAAVTKVHNCCGNH